MPATLPVRPTALLGMTLFENWGGMWAAARRSCWKEAAQRESKAVRELRTLLRQAQMLDLPAETDRQDDPGAQKKPLA